MNDNDCPQCGGAGLRAVTHICPPPRIIPLDMPPRTAEVERDLAIAWLGEPCAECGHIDWRADPNPAHEWLRRAEAYEELNKRLRNALDWIEAEPEDPIKVQLWARAALAGAALVREDASPTEGKAT